MGTVIAVCISRVRGVAKRPIPTGFFIENWGLDQDAHAGTWHRQVSLLSKERIDAFRAKGAEVEYGDFGENLVVSGIDFAGLPIGTRLRCGSVLLEMTQIGKECHAGCAIFQKMGECIMPKQGVFARVIQGGTLAAGDTMIVEE